MIGTKKLYRIKFNSENIVVAELYCRKKKIYARNELFKMQDVDANLSVRLVSDQQQSSENSEARIKGNSSYCSTKKIMLFSLFR